MSTLKATNIKNESSASNNIVLDSNGNVSLTGVAIGAASPTAGIALDVTGNIATDAASYFYNSTRDGLGIWYNPGGAGVNQLTARLGGTDRLTIDSSGRLLVGTSSAVSAGAPGNAYLQIKGRAGGTVGRLTLASTSTAPSTNSVVSEMYFTDADGGIYGQIECVADGTAGTNDYPGRLVFSTTADGASSPTERMRLSKEGRLDVFADTPIRPRSSTGPGTSDALLYGLHSATSTTNGTPIYAIWTNGTTQNLSDQRQKKNIETTRDGYLEDLRNLRVVKYHWASQQNNEPKELGLIAQEVEQVFPGIVSTMNQTDSDIEDLKGIKTSVIQFMLLKALQEAAEKIETLEAKVAALESA